MSAIGRHVVNNESEMILLGRAVARHLKEGDVVALDGELGAGKTQLVKGIAAALGSKATVTSPTFTIVHKYASPTTCLHHMDLYRLDSVEEALRAGLDDLLPPEEGITLVEWASKFPSLIPGDALHIEIRHDPLDPTRRIVDVA